VGLNWGVCARVPRRQQRQQALVVAAGSKLRPVRRLVNVLLLSQRAPIERGSGSPRQLKGEGKEGWAPRRSAAPTCARARGPTAGLRCAVGMGWGSRGVCGLGGRSTGGWCGGPYPPNLINTKSNAHFKKKKKKNNTTPKTQQVGMNIISFQASIYLLVLAGRVLWRKAWRRAAGMCVCAWVCICMYMRVGVHRCGVSPSHASNPPTHTTPTRQNQSPPSPSCWTGWCCCSGSSMRSTMSPACWC
jgi:hypothetical protein